MAYIPTIAEGDADGLLGRIYAGARTRAGKVYQILQIMSLSPRLLQCSMRFYAELMKGEGPLPCWIRELLAVVVSRANGCHY